MLERVGKLEVSSNVVILVMHNHAEYSPSFYDTNLTENDAIHPKSNLETNILNLPCVWFKYCNLILSFLENLLNQIIRRKCPRFVIKKGLMLWRRLHVSTSNKYYSSHFEHD